MNEIENLKNNIEKFKPFNEQEEVDKRIMLKYIYDFDDVLTRQNEYGHFTSSAFVLNKERTKMLMIYHNINHGHGLVDIVMEMQICYM